MLHYIEGNKNILADNLSCLHCFLTPEVAKTGRPLVDPTGVKEIDEIDGYILDQYHSRVSDKDLTYIFECYRNIPQADSPEECLLSYEYSQVQQQADATLLARQKHCPSQYINKSLDDDVQVQDIPKMTEKVSFLLPRTDCFA